jgi:hypothetical protein
MGNRKYGPAPEQGVWQGVIAPLRPGARATARIRCKEGWLHLGSFVKTLDAARAVDDALWELRGRRPNWEASGVHEELNPETPVAPRGRVMLNALRVCAERPEAPLVVRDPLHVPKKPRRPYIGVKCANLCVKAGDQPIWTACYALVLFGRAFRIGGVFGGSRPYPAWGESVCGPPAARVTAHSLALLALWRLCRHVK